VRSWAVLLKVCIVLGTGGKEQAAFDIYGFFLGFGFKK
jgi:hypothetical protein